MSEYQNANQEVGTIEEYSIVAKDVIDLMNAVYYLVRSHSISPQKAVLLFDVCSNSDRTEIIQNMQLVEPVPDIPQEEL